MASGEVRAEGVSTWCTQRSGGVYLGQGTSLIWA